MKNIMENQIICTKEVELLDEKYIIYLKIVPSKIAPGGNPESMTLRAFIRRM